MIAKRPMADQCDLGSLRNCGAWIRRATGLYVAQQPEKFLAVVKSGFHNHRDVSGAPPVRTYLDNSSVPDCIDKTISAPEIGAVVVVALEIRLARRASV